MAMMHSELIEWRIGKPRRAHRPNEGWVFHSEGAQSTFGLTRARRILKNLGAGWEIRHATTFEPPQKD